MSFELVIDLQSISLIIALLANISLVTYITRIFLADFKGAFPDTSRDISVFYSDPHTDDVIYGHLYITLFDRIRFFFTKKSNITKDTYEDGKTIIVVKNGLFLCSYCLSFWVSLGVSFIFGILYTDITLGFEGFCISLIVSSLVNRK